MPIPNTSSSSRTDIVRIDKNQPVKTAALLIEPSSCTSPTSEASWTAISAAAARIIGLFPKQKNISLGRLHQTSIVFS
jgi:hypothetical protein